MEVANDDEGTTNKERPKRGVQGLATVHDQAQVKVIQ